MLTAFIWGGLAAASLLVGFFLAARGLSKRVVGVVMGFGLILDLLLGAVQTFLAYRERKKAE